MKTLATIKKSTGTFDRVNKINLINRGKSLQLRWSYQTHRYSLTIPGGISQAAVNAAYAKASIIAADISLDRFDPTLDKYAFEQKRPPRKPEESTQTVQTLWETYKEQQRHRAAATTQKTIWREIDRAIAQLPKHALDLKNLPILGDEYLKIRSASTAHRHLATLQPAIRAAIPGVKLRERLPKQPKRTIYYFSPDEVKAILAAFSGHHYERYVTFLAATGCRPEEAIALTTSDIVRSPQGTECHITKVHTQGILQSHTKNHLIRVIPLSEQAERATRSHQKGILFPSPGGGYINSRNFLRRAWRPIILPLVKSQGIRRYLPPYSLRHSFISNMHYIHGVPLPTIAFLVGDKTETIIRFYAGLQPLHSKDLPSLY